MTDISRARINRAVAEAAGVPRRTFLIGILISVALTLGLVAMIGGAVVRGQQGQLTDQATQIKEQTAQIGRLSDQAVALTAIAEQNRANGEQIKQTLGLVASVTGPDSQARQVAATKKILKDNAEEDDCRLRRARAGLPAPPDPDSSCKDQTDNSVYPGDQSP